MRFEAVESHASENDEIFIYCLSININNVGKYHQQLARYALEMHKILFNFYALDLQSQNNNKLAS